MSLPIVRAGVDTAALGGLIATFLGWMGPIGALLAVIWYGLQIYESKAVQDFLAKRASKREMRAAIAAAKAQLAVPQAPSGAAPGPATPA